MINPWISCDQLHSDASLQDNVKYLLQSSEEHTLLFLWHGFMRSSVLNCPELPKPQVISMDNWVSDERECPPLLKGITVIYLVDTQNPIESLSKWPSEATVRQWHDIQVPEERWSCPSAHYQSHHQVPNNKQCNNVQVELWENVARSREPLCWAGLADKY